MMKHLLSPILLGLLAFFGMFAILYFGPEIDRAANGNPMIVALFVVVFFGFIGTRWAVWYLKNKW